MTRQGRSRRAFTLMEMLIAVTILALLGTAVIRILVVQTHLFQKAAAQRETRVVARAARNVVDSDLRMIETSNGLVAASATSITVRSPYAMGIVCGTSGGSTIVSVAPVDSAVWSNAGLSGYAWRAASGAYTTVEAGVGVSASPATVCTNASITTLARGRVVAVVPALPAGAVAGTPVLFHQRLLYEFKASALVPGSTGLWPTIVATGAGEELVAPFTSAAHFKFFVLNNDLSQDAVPSPLANARGIEFVLTSRSSRLAAGSSAPESTLVHTAIFFRNRLN